MKGETIIKLLIISLMIVLIVVVVHQFRANPQVSDGTVLRELDSDDIQQGDVWFTRYNNDTIFYEILKVENYYVMAVVSSNDKEFKKHLMFEKTEFIDNFMNKLK